jgi:Ferritin-like
LDLSIRGSTKLFFQQQRASFRAGKPTRYSSIYYYLVNQYLIWRQRRDIVQEGEAQMKTIAAFVGEGIATVPDLRDALQLAMQLEFSTIPPYLCALWSIDTNADPGGVAALIETIVIQEMYQWTICRPREPL